MKNSNRMIIGFEGFEGHLPKEKNLFLLFSPLFRCDKQ